MIRNVTGKEFDGSSINITIGKTQIEFLSFSYSDNLETEYIYELGSQVSSAQTPGQYKPGDGKLKIRSSVARAKLFPALPQFGAGNKITQAVCNYLHPDIGADSDLLIDFRFLGGSTQLEASAKATEIELTVKYTEIAWTSKRIRFGNRLGSGSIGTFRL